MRRHVTASFHWKWLREAATATLPFAGGWSAVGFSFLVAVVTTILTRSGGSVMDDVVTFLEAFVLALLLWFAIQLVLAPRRIALRLLSTAAFLERGGVLSLLTTYGHEGFDLIDDLKASERKHEKSNEHLRQRVQDWDENNASVLFVMVSKSAATYYKQPNDLPPRPEADSWQGALSAFVLDRIRSMTKLASQIAENMRDED